MIVSYTLFRQNVTDITQNSITTQMIPMTRHGLSSLKAVIHRGPMLWLTPLLVSSSDHSFCNRQSVCMTKFVPCSPRHPGPYCRTSCDNLLPPSLRFPCRLGAYSCVFFTSLWLLAEEPRLPPAIRGCLVGRQAMIVSALSKFCFRCLLWYS